MSAALMVFAKNDLISSLARFKRSPHIRFTFLRSNPFAIICSRLSNLVKSVVLHYFQAAIDL
jgi:hypothetical protein